MASRPVPGRDGWSVVCARHRLSEARPAPEAGVLVQKTPLVTGPIAHKRREIVPLWSGNAQFAAVHGCTRCLIARARSPLSVTCVIAQLSTTMHAPERRFILACPASAAGRSYAIRTCRA